MAPITPAQFANRKNLGFLGVVANASIISANTKINIASVAPNTAGYQAYLKRTNLAQAVIKNPDQFASAFASELLVASQTAADEQDPTILTTSIDTAWDFVAGVTQNDINL